MLNQNFIDSINAQNERFGELDRELIEKDKLIKFFDKQIINLSK